MPIQTNSVPTYPIGEPTSALNLAALQTDVAYKFGVAYYGSTGQGAPQPPIDPHDLALVNGIINDGIRMFLSDGPAPNGWSFLKPVAQVDLWPAWPADIIVNTTTSVTSTAYDSTQNLTTLSLHYNPSIAPSTIGQVGNSTAPMFFPSMELRNIYTGGNPPPNTPGFPIPPNSTLALPIGIGYTIVNYINQSTIQVYSTTPNISTSTTWSIASVGDYTMPADFGGTFSGEITYIANTNRGMVLQWTSEGNIRSRRQNYNTETGTPFELAVRIMPTPTLQGLTYAPQRRRWEIMSWRISNEFLHVIFPYVLSFNNLTNSTDLPPTPFQFDEALKAAIFATGEKQVEDTIDGPDWQYYRNIALKNAYRIEAMSAPKKLGYNGNWGAVAGSWGQVIENFRQADYQRPNVVVS